MADDISNPTDVLDGPFIVRTIYGADVTRTKYVQHARDAWMTCAVGAKIIDRNGHDITAEAVDRAESLDQE